MKKRVLFSVVYISLFYISLFLASLPQVEAIEAFSDKLPSDSTPLPLESLLEEDVLDSFIATHGIERSDRLASFFLFEAEKALGKGDGNEAIRLGKMAAKVSPLSPAPSFFLAEAVWETNRFDFIDISSHYLSGLSLVLSDFLSLVPVLSSFLFLFLLAILLSMLTFMLYSLFSYAHIWIHQVSEFSRGYLHLIPAGLLFALIFLTPLLMGLPILWILLFSFILFWGLYNRTEKRVILTFILGLGASTWILPLLVALLTVNDSILLKEMSRNYRSDYLWTAPEIELMESDWEGWFISASYEAQQGHYKEAIQLYEHALKKNPDSPTILNNMGNLSFYLKDYTQAVEYYEEALNHSPRLVSAYYNLGQSYQEMLLFEKGSMMISKAKAINTQAAELYAMKSERYPEFPVINEHFTKADLWKTFLNEKGDRSGFSSPVWESMLGQVPIGKAPFISMTWVITLILSGFFYKHFYTGKPCTFCKKAICGKCAKRLFSYQVCKPCELRFLTIRKKKDYSIIEDAVKKIPTRLYPMFLLPGGGHLAIQKTKTGFFFLFCFYVLISSIFIGNLLIPTSELNLHYSESFIPEFLILSFLYLIVFMDLILKRRAHKWL